MSELTYHLAKHLRDVVRGGNWTTVSYEHVLRDVTLDMASTRVGDRNTIVTLLFHAAYYVTVLRRVLEGGPLQSRDEESFHVPEPMTEALWRERIDMLLSDADASAVLIESMSEQQLWHDFTDAKYGTWYRNIAGIIEHAHYHLGQIVLLKAMLMENGAPNDDSSREDPASSGHHEG